MRAWPAQYEKPVTAALPQNAKSAACGSPIGQWHLSCAISSSEQRCALSIGAGLGGRVGGDAGAAAPIKRSSRPDGDGVPGARRAGARRSTCGRRWRQAEAVNFADHGVAGDADLGGDLTASQAGADTVPGAARCAPQSTSPCSIWLDRTASRLRRRVWPPKGEAARNGTARR